jgi:DNA-binding CsgD family transcriptional regulator
VKGGDARDAIAIALLIDDPLLADRLVAVLGDVPGVRLVPRGEPADVVLVSTGNSANAASADDAAAMTDTASDALDASPSTDALLTPREREVLALLAEGASNKAIARTLGISVHTAKFHVGSLLDKLDATGRTDAVTHAARRGVIDL